MFWNFRFIFSVSLSCVYLLYIFFPCLYTYVTFSYCVYVICFLNRFISLLIYLATLGFDFCSYHFFFGLFCVWLWLLWIQIVFISLVIKRGHFLNHLHFLLRCRFNRIIPNFIEVRYNLNYSSRISKELFRAQFPILRALILDDRYRLSVIFFSAEVFFQHCRILPI